MQLSMFSSEERHASPSPSPASERDWQTLVATWPSSFSALLIATVPKSWFGKMSPVSCHRGKDGILVPSSGGWQNSGMVSATESWTLSSAEHAATPELYHNGGGVCSLSDVLETTGNVPQRYYLSSKACKGILRRAEKRGKVLPPQLQAALQAVADSERTSTATEDLSPPPMASPTVSTGGGMGRIDYETETMIAHALRGEGHDASEDGTGRGTPIVPVDVAGTMKAMRESGGFSNSADHAASGYMIPVAYRTAGDGAVYEEGDRTAPLTTASDRNANIVAFDTTQITSAGNYSNPRPGDPCHPLAAGAHPPAITEPLTLAIRGRGDSHNLEYRQDGTANAVLTPNGGRAGIGVGAIAHGWAVRRLTPLECVRLMGLPDDYFSSLRLNKPFADGPIYKMLGNSFAVNVVRWIGERIDAVNEIERKAS